jgi:hypothetical protein
LLDVAECRYLSSRGDNFVVEALGKNLDQGLVKEALRETDRESKRVRALPATFTTWFTILMGIHRRQSYENILEKLDGTWWTRAHWSSEKVPNSSSVTKARDRIGIEPMKFIYERSAARWLGETNGEAVFRGRRVYGLDGSTLKVPDTEENADHFKYPGASRGSAAYPQMRIVGLEDVGTRMMRAIQHGPYSTGEMPLSEQMLPDINAKSIILMDKNFLAYDFLWDVCGRGAEFLVRVKKNIKPKVLKTIASGDEIVEVSIPRYYRKRRPDMPRVWKLRQITYEIEGSDEIFRLFTPILDETATHAEFKALYHERWDSETTLDEIKTHLCDCTTVNRPVIFRSKTPDRVVQELYGLLIAYNAIRKAMADAVEQEDIPPRRLSFTAALERLREAIRDMMQLEPELLPYRWRKLLTSVARNVVPYRPGRRYPRAVKIKMSNYPLKRTG